MAVQALQSSGVGLRRILAHFPEDLSLAFAYGSAVYRQAGPSAYQENPMLDLVFTVDDPVAWHAKNLKKNWGHYSFLKFLGPRIISSVQNNYGAGVYFNPLIMCDGKGKTQVIRIGRKQLYLLSPFTGPWHSVSYFSNEKSSFLKLEGSSIED